MPCLVDHDLPEHRAPDAGQSLLLRALDRQQIEAVGHGVGAVIDAYREIERGVKVVRCVQLFDRHRAIVMAFNPATMDDGMVDADRRLEAERDLLPIAETLRVPRPLVAGRAGLTSR